MSTRLYIESENPEVLEILASVPTGTYNKWLVYSAAIESMKKNGEDSSFVPVDKEVDELDRILTYGLKKLSRGVHQMLKSLNLDPCWDSTHDPSVIEKILEKTGLLPKFVKCLGPNYLEKIQGLVWD